MANGGIIGPINIISVGKCKVTTKTSSGDITTQPGTRVVSATIVAGGAAGGAEVGGGGGAGGVKTVDSINVQGTVPVTVGAGGAKVARDDPGGPGSNSIIGGVSSTGGGGGNGMRIVMEKKELFSSMKQAMSEAKSAFGNPMIFVEKYLESPRHIEFQILADNYGNVVHLFERECSVQRRHQKLIEEAPSTVMTLELRSRMGKAALKAVKASNYTNAGTVEFMVDKDRNFYFLEMNTRLQVEHPVTELITGIDIVKEQLKIASGGKLSLKQDDVKINGTAIECRISAEDPENNFAPSTGKIIELSEPGGPGIRVESGIFEGFEVPVYYDPLIAKLLVWAPTSHESIARMKRALREYRIRGIKTSIPFHLLVMDNSGFIDGNYDTTFIDKVLGGVEYKKQNYDIAAISSIIGKVLEENRTRVSEAKKESYISPWKLSARPGK